MGLSRGLNQDGIRHANADSLTHAKHVRERKNRREVEWYADDVRIENPAAEFSLRADGLELQNGIYFVGVGETEKQVDGKVFENHLSAVNWSRRYNFASMKRGEKVCTVRRKRSSPACRELVVNLAPWEMRFINFELERWEKMKIPAQKRTEMLLAFLEPMRGAVVTDYKDSTGMDVLGSYAHLDGSRVHFGIIGSVVGEDNKLLCKLPPQIGSFTVASARAAQVGVKPSNSWLADNLQKFAKRHGEGVEPIDMRMHRILDAEFDKMVVQMARVDPSATRRYDEAKQYYRDWKSRRRHDVLMRSSSAQRIGWDVLQMAMPLFPPQVRTAISICRTAVQAFRVLSVALDAAKTDARESAPSPQISKMINPPH